MKSDLKVRPFRIDDYDEVVSLWKEAGIALSLSDTRESLEAKSRRDAELFIVLEQLDDIVGVVMGCFDGRRGWINHLAVLPSRQGRGLGQYLVSELEERFRAIGCEKVNLLIELDNAEVQSFYRRFGYARDDLIFMEKWL